LIDTALVISHDLIAGVLRRAKNAATKTGAEAKQADCTRAERVWRGG
jgi:hypothetical protein